MRPPNARVAHAPAAQHDTGAAWKSERCVAGSYAAHRTTRFAHLLAVSHTPTSTTADKAGRGRLSTDHNSAPESAALNHKQCLVGVLCGCCCGCAPVEAGPLTCCHVCHRLCSSRYRLPQPTQCGRSEVTTPMARYHRSRRLSYNCAMI
jgi:hypothetical protein